MQLTLQGHNNLVPSHRQRGLQRCHRGPNAPRVPAIADSLYCSVILQAESLTTPHGVPSVLNHAVQWLLFNTGLAGSLKIRGCAGSTEEDVPGGSAPLLPPGFSHIQHKHWVEYGVQCPAHGSKSVRNYEQLERMLRRHAACRCEADVSHVLLPLCIVLYCLSRFQVLYAIWLKQRCAAGQNGRTWCSGWANRSAGTGSGCWGWGCTSTWG